MQTRKNAIAEERAEESADAQPQQLVHVDFRILLEMPTRACEENSDARPHVDGLIT
jgi:hypothetical protein